MTPGLRIFHNHIAIELVERLGGTDDMQLWCVKPAFLEGAPLRDVIIYRSDVCTPITGHTSNL